MKQSFKIEIAKKRWKSSLNWTFDQIDILNEANIGTGLLDFEESKEFLRESKKRIEEEKSIIIAEFHEIGIYVKPVRNFKSALDKLLNSSEIDKVKRNLEINWIALNQSYGRMLIKLKLNNYEIE